MYIYKGLRDFFKSSNTMKKNKKSSQSSQNKKCIKKARKRLKNILIWTGICLQIILGLIELITKMKIILCS